ncbi:MAG: hypothetical protein LBU27_04315 [Candidatus Peribacteria bacterium]|nr:hypothetical protein [Candidatus Peribacteria bacterium]
MYVSVDAGLTLKASIGNNIKERQLAKVECSNAEMLMSGFISGSFENVLFR